MQHIHGFSTNNLLKMMGGRAHLRLRLTLAFANSIYKSHPAIIHQLRSLASGRSRPKIYLFTDASNYGHGGYYLKSNQSLNSLKPSAVFSKAAEPTPHTLHNELSAIKHAFTTWGDELRGHDVVVNCDNQGVVDGLSGKHMPKGMNDSFKEAYLMAQRSDINITPRWISSKQNKFADMLSRGNAEGVVRIAPNLKGVFGKVEEKVGRQP